LSPGGIIEDLEDHGLKPDILAVDAGYVSGKNILDAEEQDVVLLGPLTTGRSSDNDKLSLASIWILRTVFLNVHKVLLLYSLLRMRTVLFMSGLIVSIVKSVLSEIDAR
jgi:hypothetical protein